MPEIFLRESLDYLLEAQDYLNLYVPMDSYTEIFEADDPEVQKQTENNKNALKGASGSLAKAGNAIYNFIMSIIQKFKSLFTGKKKKELEGTKQAFNAAVSKKPSLNNKTVQVQDWKGIHNDYANLLKQIDDCEEKLELNPTMDISAVLKSVDNFTGNLGSRAWAAYKVDLALNMASTSQEVAAKAYNDLKNNAEEEQKLINTLGKSEVKKFEKDLKRLSSKHQLIRARAKAGDAVCKNSMEAINKTNNTVREMINSVMNITADGIVGDKRGDGFVAGVVGSKNLNNNIKELTNTKDKKRILKNMHAVQGSIQTGKNINGVQHIFKPTKQEQNKMEKYQRKIEKNRDRGDYSDQSRSQALLGENIDRKVDRAKRVYDEINEVRRQFTGQ